MNSADEAKLKAKLLLPERAITRNPEDHNAHYLKAYWLHKFGRYDQALDSYCKAISISEERKYFAGRFRLYVDQGNLGKAVDDIDKLNQLPVDESDEFSNIRIKNLQKTILRLEGVQKAVEQLRLNGEISPEFEKILTECRDIAQANVVRIEVLDGISKEHTGILVNHDDRISDLENTVEQLISRGKETAKSLAKFEAEVDVLKEIKANTSDIEPFAFKKDKRIANEPKLNDYHETLYNELYSMSLEATVISGDHLAIETSRILVTGAASAIGFLDKFAKYTGQLISSAIAVYDKKQIKRNAAELARNFGSGPSAKHNFIKLLAEIITLEHEDRILNITPEHEEIKAWGQSSVIQNLKDFFVHNSDKYAEYNTQQILACVDASKIVYVLQKGPLEGDKSECDMVINQLLDVPINYKLAEGKNWLVKNVLAKELPCVGLPIYSDNEVVHINQLETADELIEVPSQQEI